MKLKILVINTIAVLSLLMPISFVFSNKELPDRAASIASFSLQEKPYKLIERLTIEHGKAQKLISKSNPGEPEYCYYRPKNNEWFVLSLFS